MKLELKEIVRPNILSLKPYQSARSITSNGKIFLDANEAPDDPLMGLFLNRYPNPQPPTLRQQLAAFYDVGASRICMGRGSDEAIDLLVRMTCIPNLDTVLTCPPTYGMYAVAADIQGAKNIEVPMLLEDKEFRLDMERVSAALRDPTIKLFFICRPNNPTGEIISLDQVANLAARCGPKRLLVVDEAYIEFSDEPSAIRLIDQYPNIVVLRTCSKAWALAGVRFGVAISSPEIADILSRIRAPYPVPTPVSDLILQNLQRDRSTTIQKNVVLVRSERERMKAELSRFGSVALIYPSVTNFLLVKMHSHAEEFFRHLAASGIIIRNRSNQPLLTECLRITIGSPEDNNALLTAWNAWEGLRDA